MGWFWSKKKSITEQERKQLDRRCKRTQLAYENCAKANLDNPGYCTNLENSVISCYGETLCKAAADEHRRCYTSLINVGHFNGQHNCTKYVQAIKKGLDAYGIDPLKR